MPVHDPEDDLPLLRRQDRAAFTRLVQGYHASMLRLAASLGGESRAEEIVQESWLSAFRALPAFEGRCSLKTWLCTIVRNQARSLYRQEARRQEEVFGLPETDAGDQSLGGTVSFDARGFWERPPSEWAAASPEALLMESQLRACIEHTLTLLSGHQKAVFLLRDVEQLEMAEICNILALSHSNARVLLHRARLRLWKVIARYQETGTC